MTAPDHTPAPFKNHLHQRGHPYMRKTGDGRGAPFPGRTYPTASYRYAERGEAVEHGNADLELGDLTIEVPGHEALAQQLHTMHLRLDAASAVIPTPMAP